MTVAEAPRTIVRRVTNGVEQCRSGAPRKLPAETRNADYLSIPLGGGWCAR